MHSWDEFGAYFDKMTATGVVQSMKDFYWDIRPKPEFGTIELRVCDTPLAVDKAAALACYLQCICRQPREERPFEPSEGDYLVTPSTASRPAASDSTARSSTPRPSSARGCAMTSCVR